LPEFKIKLKKLLFFSEPEKDEGFILKENLYDKSEEERNRQDIENNSDKKPSPKSTRNENILYNKQKGEELDGKNVDKSQKDDKQNKGQKPEISKKLSDNLEYMKKVYTIPINGDVILREFDITIKDDTIEAFIIFFDGMVDRKLINEAILQPLMLLSNLDIKGKFDDIASYISKHLLPQNQLKVVNGYKELIGEVNFGGCGIFIDGVSIAFTADVKGWEHRNVERPNTELVIRGPQEGFTEVLRVNTALIRKILKDEDFIVENMEIGRRSKTPCSLLYIKDIANDSLVNEARRRLKSLKVDYIIDSGELEQLIEDNTYLPIPQIIDTERPDKVASLLTEGKVGVLVHGSPYALVMPATLTGLLHSPEDSYIRFPYSNFLRFIRVMAILLTLLLPGLYLAITNFHPEMIPTDLLLAIEASREKVPFPSVVEVLMLEISFELIREAGIRIPGPIGPTLGIIGALILGQAAVAANIVSPILIIIVAVTGIGSFAIPTFSLAFSFRLLRFGYIILGAMAGFLGITTGLFIQGIILVNSKSFGIPLLIPFGPRTKGAATDEIIRAPIWKQERRPDSLNTKDDKKQPHISRRWVIKKRGE